MRYPANQNRTHLYRIRRKSDGLFLSHISQDAGGHEFKGTWQPTGSFWRTQDTIRKHLLELITYRVYIADHPMNSWHQFRPRGMPLNKVPAPQFTVFPCGTKKGIVGVFYQWLDHYEVVATEITVHGEDVLEARTFASFLMDKENIA